jgi:hypothetical protein
MLVEAGAPGVVPQAAPVGLLLEAHDLGDLGALALRRRECPELGEARRAGPDDGDALLGCSHFQNSPYIYWKQISL